MRQALRHLLIFSLLILVLNPAAHANQSDADTGDEPVIDVMGKVVDHDYLEVLGAKIYLPKILLVDGSWYFYSNTQSAIESGDFQRVEGAIVRSDGAPVTLDMSITSHLMYVWFGIILTLFCTIWAARRYRRGIGESSEPKGAAHNIFEVFFVFIRDDIAKEYISPDKYKRYVPYLFSVFMAISFMNLFGLFPWGVSATADLTVTATLAGITFFITQFSGSKDHWRHVFLFPGVHPLIRIILTPVEILGLFTKPFALAIRLFANMLSGKILIVCILGLIFIFTDIFGPMIGVGSSVVWVALTAALYILKAFIALLQAYIFTLLSAVFIGMAAEEHHHEEHDTSVATATEVKT
ncbi:ATP synthase F0 subunit A [Rhodohalobacter sp. SW132]|uniref:F0F1 ATP synthase subunit A n=1 Tax=Rhodohalobacter sp. SW132 TaxID=2293433 RepID=UPI000E266A44|nr:F0F1 ATP synthase subunit A [Rhodohalobacter sp. SW132]REL33314.1 ATP synthase F0 subunit A [Rhodohalobacter sp. SW132]